MLLGLALLINITVLIFFVIGPVGLVAWVIGRRAEATRALVTIGACLLTYYGFHAVSGYGADIALHEYLVKAASLEDYGEDTAPTLSWLRVQQFAWGARAMFLTPGIYRMDLPTDLDTIVRGVLPIVVLGLYVALALWTLRKRQGGEATVWPLLPASVVGVSVAFPYFYEPLLIERWDLFWLCHVLGCIIAEIRPRMVSRSSPIWSSSRGPGTPLWFPPPLAGGFSSRWTGTPSRSSTRFNPPSRCNRLRGKRRLHGRRGWRTRHPVFRSCLSVNKMDSCGAPASCLGLIVEMWPAAGWGPHSVAWMSTSTGTRGAHESLMKPDNP